MRNYIIISFLFIIMPYLSYAQNFYDQRYRGWLWFEDREISDDQKRVINEQQEAIDKQKAFTKARKEVEKFAKELEDLRYMMIRYPESVEHVLAYKKKEAEMFANAIKIDQTYRLAALIDPNHVDRLNNPLNLYGRKIQAKLDEENLVNQVKELANQVELFLFFSSNCPYCAQLEPVLADFAKKYGFRVEAVSIDDGESNHFKTHHNKALIESLKVEQVPTVMLVTKDSKIRFELIRGAASISELEEYSALALKHIKSLKLNNAKKVGR